MAGTEKRANADPDWTVGVKLVRHGHKFYVADIIRVQQSAGDVDALVHHTAVLDGPEVPIREEQEPGSAGLAVIAMRRKHLVGYNYRGVPSTTAKELRWQPMLIEAEMNGIPILKAPWNGALLSEVTAAPHGANDDQLDSLAGAFNELARGGSVSVHDLLSIGHEPSEWRSAAPRKIF
jgi:predicted phage terminase large subunit-like protein